MSTSRVNIWPKSSVFLKSEEKISDLAQKKVIFSSLFSIILRPTVTADRIIEVISKLKVESTNDSKG
jgi:hypothetical protein